MKKTVLLFLFFTVSAIGQKISIMSYNLRVDFGGDGENNWEFRKQLLTDVLLNYHPDFI